MKFSCENCGAQYLIADEKLGRRGVKVRCKKCSNVIIVRPAGFVAPTREASPGPRTTVSGPPAASRAPSAPPSATIDLTLGDSGAVRSPASADLESSSSAEWSTTGESYDSDAAAAAHPALDRPLPATKPAHAALLSDAGIDSMRHPDPTDGLELRYDELARGGQPDAEPSPPMDDGRSREPDPNLDLGLEIDVDERPLPPSVSARGQRVFGERDETRVSVIPAPPPPEPTTGASPRDGGGFAAYDRAPSADLTDVPRSGPQSEAEAELNAWLDAPDAAGAPDSSWPVAHRSPASDDDGAQGDDHGPPGVSSGDVSAALARVARDELTEMRSSLEGELEGIGSEVDQVSGPTDAGADDPIPQPDLDALNALAATAGSLADRGAAGSEGNGAVADGAFDGAAASDGTGESDVAEEIGNAFAVMFGGEEEDDTGADEVAPQPLPPEVTDVPSDDSPPISEPAAMVEAEISAGPPAEMVLPPTTGVTVNGESGAEATAESTTAAVFDWYVGIDDEQVGPLTFDELRVKWQTGVVGPTSLAWRQGMTDWTTIRLIAELAELHSPSAHPHVAPGPDVDEPLAPALDHPAGTVAAADAARRREVRVEPASGPAEVRVAPSAPARTSVSMAGGVGAAMGSADMPEAGWRPSAASALASLAAEELSAPEPKPKGPATDTKAGPALPATTDALERLLEGKSHPRATAFGAAEKSESRVQLLPRQPDTVSSAPLRDRSGPPRRRGSLGVVAAIVGGFVVFGLIIVAALYLFLRPPGPSGTKDASKTATLPTNVAPVTPSEPATAAGDAKLSKVSGAPEAPKTASAPPPPASAIDAKALSKTPPPPKSKPKPKVKAKAKPKRTRTSKKVANKTRRPSRARRRAPPPPPRELDDASLLNPKGVRRSAPPASRSDLPQTLDETDILGVLRKNRNSVRTCLSRHASSGSGVQGTMTVYMVVRSTGRPTRVSVSPEFRNTVAGTCIVDAVRRWRFPRFAGESLPVDFPVTVRGG